MYSLISAVTAGFLALGPATPVPTQPSAPLPVWLKLSADSGHSGEKVSIQAACEDESGPLTTKALRVTKPLARNAEGHQPWALFGEASVADVRPGMYSVSFRCAGKLVATHFLVQAKQKPVQVKVVPKGAPQTGDGST